MRASTSMSTSMAMAMAMATLAMADVSSCSCCHWRRGACKACSFYRARANKGQRRHNNTTSPAHAEPNPSQPKLNPTHPMPIAPAATVAASPGAALIIFMLPRRRQRQSAGAVAVTGEGAGGVGYKMSISSNNAIDKRRQSSRRGYAALQAVQRGVWQVCAQLCDGFMLQHKDRHRGGRGGRGWLLAPRQLPSNFKLKEAQN